jgi:hypothetical protein
MKEGSGGGTSFCEGLLRRTLGEGSFTEGPKRCANVLWAGLSPHKDPGGGPGGVFVYRDIERKETHIWVSLLDPEAFYDFEAMGMGISPYGSSVGQPAKGSSTGDLRSVMK